jgi:hypothetical protein
MEEAKSELSRIIQDREMRNVVLLVFANKQDVDGGRFHFFFFLKKTTSQILTTFFFLSHAT